MDNEIQQLKIEHELLKKKFEALLNILLKLEVDSDGCCHSLSLIVRESCFDTNSLHNEIYNVRDIGE